MTAWIVSEMYYPEETNTGYIMTKIAEAIAETGESNRVEVLCAQPNYAGRGTRAPSRDERLGVSICRVRSSTLDRHRVIARIVNQATVTLSLGLHCLFRFRAGDVALVVTTPPTLPFVVAAAAMLRGTRLIVLVHDMYPEVLVAAGMAEETTMPVRLLRALRRVVLQSAARVIVIGRDQRERLLADDLLAPSQVVVVPNWADVDVVTGREKESSKMVAELGLDAHFVVQYAGNIGPVNGIEFILEGIDRLRSDPAIHFLFVGHGGRRPWLEAEINRRGLQNVTIVNWVARAESDDMHRAADLALISLSPGMRGVSVPSRTYNTLASARPILFVGDQLSETARVVHEEGVGWVVPPGDIDAFIQAVREAASDPARLRRMGAAARDAAERRYARQRVLERFREIVSDVGLESRSASIGEGSDVRR